MVRVRVRWCVCAVVLTRVDRFDVWMGNVRGNRFSREHAHFKVDSTQYWKYAFTPALFDWAEARALTTTLYGFPTVSTAMTW